MSEFRKCRWEAKGGMPPMTQYPKDLRRPTPDSRSCFSSDSILADGPINTRLGTTSKTANVHARPYAEKNAGRTIGITQQIEERLKEIENGGIELSNLAQLRQYLSMHMDMIGPLTETCRIVKGIIDKEATAILQIYEDPEIDDRYLLICIRQKQYDEKVDMWINEITDKYSKVIEGRTGWLLVMTDYQ